MRLEDVSVTELEGMVREGPVAPLRVGATNNPRRRAGEYKTEYNENATMYYAKTSNMRTAENRLLGKCAGRGGCCFNVHRRSNHRKRRGYIYAILP